jgi:hypothetical protein
MNRTEVNSLLTEHPTRADSGGHPSSSPSLAATSCGPSRSCRSFTRSSSLGGPIYARSSSTIDQSKAPICYCCYDLTLLPPTHRIVVRIPTTTHTHIGLIPPPYYPITTRRGPAFREAGREHTQTHVFGFAGFSDSLFAFVWRAGGIRILYKQSCAVSARVPESPGSKQRGGNGLAGLM